MIFIDGEYGEGGGQIIRTALSLSAITGKAVTIGNIRAKRPSPGLAMQHLTGARAVRSICRGTLDGAEVGSTKLTFSPGKIVGGKYKFDIGTAGSVTLVAQTIIPILLHAEKKSQVRIIGGTHVMKSPGYDYFEKVFVPAIRRFGADVETKMINAGYYPRGGGIIDIGICPSKLKGMDFWPVVDHIAAIISLAGLPESIAIREKKIFVQEEIEEVRIRMENSLSAGNSVTAWRGCKGSYSLGEKGKRAEIVAKECLNNLMKEAGDVDLHLADQLLIYAALAEGKTEYATSEISSHMETNAHVISKFLERKLVLGKTISVQ